MKNIIEAEIDKQFVRHAEIVKHLQTLREPLKCAHAVAARFKATVETDLRQNSWAIKPTHRIYVTLRVKALTDAEPVIEYIEAWLTACTETKDFETLREREYWFPGLVLGCKLGADTENCKIVIKGYREPEPILAFECDPA